MTVLEAIRGRRSIRRFTDEPISKEALETILDAARWAPTSSPRQKWRFVVVTSPSVKELVLEFSPGIFATPAAIVVICTEVQTNQSRASERADSAACALAAQNIMLTAHEMGIGSCIVLSYSKPAIRQALDIADGVDPLFLVTLGYPAEHPEPSPRLGLGQVAYVDEYGREWE